VALAFDNLDSFDHLVAKHNIHHYRNMDIVAAALMNMGFCNSAKLEDIGLLHCFVDIAFVVVAEIAVFELADAEQS
jgi:hypothetical protein